MGTVFSIEVRGAGASGSGAGGSGVSGSGVRGSGASDSGVSADAIADVVSWLHWVDRTFSTYKPESQISRLNSGQLSLADCDPELQAVLRLGERVERDTNGYFSVNVGDRLDPSGLVKGWAIERASDLLTAAGSRDHCVNGGGDVQCVASPQASPWRIGIADPHRRGQLATVVTGGNIAVATSGTSERGQHVLDPHTGRAAAELASLTVVGPNLTLTDAYATAGMAMGSQARPWLESQPGYEAFGIGADGQRWCTSGFGVSFTPSAMSS